MFEQRQTSPPPTGDVALMAIGQSVAMILHEIRSPLSTIDLALNYLDEPNQPERTTKRVKLAQSETRRLRGLLNDILSFARPQQLQFARFDLGDLIHQVIDGLVDADKPRREVTVRLPKQPVFITADRDKLKQVFINLLSNACQATVAGAHLDVFVFRDAEANSIQVEVRNPGTIAGELLNHLAEPFVTTRTSGTGLGLAISKRIIEAHGGKLEFELPNQREVCARVSLPSTAWNR